MSLFNQMPHLQVTSWLFLIWLVIMCLLALSIWHLKQNSLRTALSSSRRYRLKHRRYYRFWILCLLSIPVSAVLGAIFLPAGFYHFQSYLYQSEQALILPAYNLYPDSILFASIGMFIWSFLLKAACSIFFKKFDAACAFFNLFMLNKWVAPDKKVGSFYRRHLKRTDVYLWARYQWQIWIKMFLAFWMIGGLWSLMELNNYIQLSPTYIRINRFWDLNEKIYLPETFHCTRQFTTAAQTGQPHIIIKLENGLQWDLMRSSHAYGLPAPVLNDLSAWIEACEQRNS